MSDSADQLSFDALLRKSAGAKPVPPPGEAAEKLPTPDEKAQTAPEMRLQIVLSYPESCFNIRWYLPGEKMSAKFARIGCFLYPEGSADKLLQFQFDPGGPGMFEERWEQTPAAIRSLIQRVRKFFPIQDEFTRFGVHSQRNEFGFRKNILEPFAEPWISFEAMLTEFALEVETHRRKGIPPAKAALASTKHILKDIVKKTPNQDNIKLLYDLDVCFDEHNLECRFEWTSKVDPNWIVCGVIFEPPEGGLLWELDLRRGKATDSTSYFGSMINAMCNDWLNRYDLSQGEITIDWIKPDSKRKKVYLQRHAPFRDLETARRYISQAVVAFGEFLKGDLRSPWEEKVRARAVAPKVISVKEMGKPGALDAGDILEKIFQFPLKPNAQKPKKAEINKRSDSSAAKAVGTPASKNPAAVPSRQPLPPIPIQFEMPPLQFQETAFPLTDLNACLLRERAALWWVSNQSDDLLCLPHCRIQKLEYQIRTALRVLGPLRGRALLSDEVGLGKTIEAGLIIKELFTRGMVKRFLVLTVPSLVDQWQEELIEKFSLATTTTNESVVRNNPKDFWTGSPGIVASLHTLKQPANLEIAKDVKWDILVVDEAHYLRNRDSQAWQAVNALPRDYLLLLTATPVQNSLEELYNLVTLLQPGQLPSPKEFRARFIDPKRPRQPKEPEELRRLLGQVMIRNTRANAGINLPPRRAESVIFQPNAQEQAFWNSWETEFRAALANLDGSQSSLWGRLVLQAAGSSPAAWRGVLEKFPDRKAAKKWREESPLESSWKRKCEMLAPLTRFEGGAVVFTQFLETQAALAEYLRKNGVDAFVINGSTPPAERQPITEQFRKAGGALLLSHSGAEGRNLQFSHHLANFDLPWNPMEIEQRIGRVHRLGQQHPVRIHNFVQAGTLQEHLLEILQEKLNLFELVVGETGLILGERFSSDEFAEEILRRWRDNEGSVEKALAELGQELATARDQYNEVKKLDETLFAKDYESV